MTPTGIDSCPDCGGHGTLEPTSKYPRPCRYCAGTGRHPSPLDITLRVGVTRDELRATHAALAAQVDALLDRLAEQATKDPELIEEIAALRAVQSRIPKNLDKAMP